LLFNFFEDVFVGAEIDMENYTLRFFCNNKQLPVVVNDIAETVVFGVYLFDFMQ
jgi:hypothetical protein